MIKDFLSISGFADLRFELWLNRSVLKCSHCESGWHRRLLGADVFMVSDEYSGGLVDSVGIENFAGNQSRLMGRFLYVLDTCSWKKLGNGPPSRCGSCRDFANTLPSGIYRSSAI